MSLHPANDPVRFGARLAAASCGAALLAGARALLASWRFASPLLDVSSSAAQVGAREGLRGFAVVVLPCVLLSFALGALRARGRRGAAVMLALAAVLAGTAFVASYLPYDRLFAPAPVGPRGQAAFGGALVAALIGVGLIALPARTRAWRAAHFALPLAALAVAAFVHQTRPRASWPEQPTIVLVSLDTTRADRLGCFGYELPTTPELDRFAAGALRLERAHSHSTWTLTAHMSLFTGLSPGAHGVDEQHTLANDRPTLAQLLRDEGYATFAVVDSCPWIGPRYGFARGFEVYRTTGAPAGDKIELALELLDKTDGRPLFLFLHLFDAHSDSAALAYESAPEDHERFAGWYDGATLGAETDARASALLLRMNHRGESLHGDARRYLGSLYDAGLRTMDRALGELFRGLEERGVLDDAIVVVTADHGEELYDHERALHSQHFVECVRVPLLMRTPDSATGSSDELVSLADVGPTVLELAGLELQGAEGRSFAPLLHGASVEPVRTHVFSEHGGAVRSVRDTRHSLVSREGTWVGFELASDPREEHPLEIEGRPELEALRALVAARQAELDALAANPPGRRIGAPSQVDRRELEQLGYAGDEPGD